MVESKKAVFISYAKQDAEAAGRISEALRSAGIEVWFDQSELRGGDAWDAAIRRQIKTCALMIPVISANTRGRAEGYFRLEWKLAVDRSHLMSHDRTFIVPVVIDDTQEGDERVPDRFREVQWTRLPGGNTPRPFVERILKLLEEDAVAAPSPATTATASAPPKLTDAGPATPEPPAGSRRRFTVLAVVSVLVLIGIGAWAAHHFWLRPPSVVAYSSQDRRMTYAVLPLQVASDDGHAAQVAKATGNEILTFLEARHELVSVVSSASAEQAVAHESAMRKIAAALDVHFLIRGTVARIGTGYQVTVLCIDGESERVLATQTLTVAADELTPHWRAAVRSAVGELIFAGLEREAKRIRSKAPDELDVRDLSILANVDWALMRDKDGKAANARANELLKRALALAPDDLYALREVAVINLCDCVNSWSPNPDEQKAVGAAAMEKYLQFDPDSLVMLYEKANLYQLRLRWEESIFIADTILAKEPNDPYTLSLKATSLLRLGRLPEARSIDEAVLIQKPDNWGALSSMANVCYAQGDYACAATMARKAVVQMSEVDLRDRVVGSVQLTLIAAEARLKHADRAQQALTDFETVLPNVKGIAAIKAWLHPSADLADTPSLFEGLREAGVGA